MITISCTRARYEELKKNPLLFLRKEDRSYFNYRGDWIKDITWVPTDNDFTANIEYKELADQENRVIFGGRLAEYKYYDIAPIIEKVMGF